MKQCDKKELPYRSGSPYKLTSNDTIKLFDHEVLKVREELKRIHEEL